jgi:tetratricopeptide (TPR) repeat protein
MSNDRIVLIKQMLDKNPEDSFLRYAVALEFKKNGDVEKSINYLEELIKKDPNYLASYYQLGKIFEEEGQAHKAIVFYRQGKLIAAKVNDRKTLGELDEALMILDADEEF